MKIHPTGRALALAGVTMVMVWTVASAQQHDEHATPGTPGAPGAMTSSIPLYKSGLGPFTRRISSSNAEAQAYFDQGLQMMYAFAKAEAIRSFREAWKRDPACAICYWGEAKAWGPFLTSRMTTEDATRAYAAARKAVSLKASASPIERALIEALSVRYVEAYDPEKRGDQDRAYAAAMRGVSEAYPNDLDAATLYGEALFLLQSGRGRQDINDPTVQRLHAVLERVLASDLRHPGACHLYVHATESTVAPAKAAPCAEYLGNAVPAVSHMNHMPSHTWSQVGRWGDAVRANIQAWHTDQKAAIGEGVTLFPDHNLHMLINAASMDGQGAVAIQAGKDYAKLTGDTIYHVLALVRFGRFDEVRAITDRPKYDVSAGLWDFAQGYARLREGQVNTAQTFLQRVVDTAQSSTATLRIHPALALLGTVGGILGGEIHRANGDLTAAIAVFERAVAMEDEIQYDEPEPLPFPVRHWLGAALVEARRFADAERVYREDLKKHPHNGWSLLGLQKALAGQGKPSAEVDADLAASWARADTWITASRF